MIKELARPVTRFGQRRPALWICAWILWFLTLWLLSSGNPSISHTEKIPHFDKIAHFGFFFGGGALLCAWLRHGLKRRGFYQCVSLTTVVGAIVGVIDEYHQSFTPGRSGNDIGDWTADTLGTLTGALVMIAVLKATSTWSARKQSQPTEESAAAHEIE